MWVQIEKYDDALETDAMIADEKGGIFEFTKKFSCLGSTISFMMDDAIDTKNRMEKAAKVMGALGFIWNSKKNRQKPR